MSTCDRHVEGKVSWFLDRCRGDHDGYTLDEIGGICGLDMSDTDTRHRLEAALRKYGFDCHCVKLADAPRDVRLAYRDEKERIVWYRRSRQ
jgi:hypothetical protein